jgi:hypothetical protein
MTLGDARTLVRFFARNADDPTQYPDAMVDRAIQFVGNHFVRATRCLVQVSTASIASGVAAVDLSGISGFRPDRLVAAYASGVAERLDQVDWETLWRRQVCTSTPGKPRRMAFADWTTMNVDPLPDQDYTLYLRWTPLFTAWAAGGGSGDTVLNLPDDWLAEIMVLGPPAILQHNEPEHAFASASWKKYQELVQSLADAGELAVRSTERDGGDRGLGGGAPWPLDAGGFVLP